MNKKLTYQQFSIQYFETILPNDIREELNYDLTVALKSIIERKGLIKTGFMLDYTNCTVSVSKTLGTFRIRINTSNYFKYLQEEYNLLEEFQSSRAYRNAIKVFDELSKGLYDEMVGLGEEKANPYI